MLRSTTTDRGGGLLPLAQPFQALPRRRVASFQTSHLQFLPPFPRGGFASRPFHRSLRHQYYEGSDSCRSHPTGRSLRLLRFAVPAFRPQPRKLPAGRFVSRLSADGCFQASPRKSRLATALRRIRFVTLRTAGSPPVAPHPASRRRSDLRLRSPRPAPARTGTVLTKRPHGRTHPRGKRRSRASPQQGAFLDFPLSRRGVREILHRCAWERARSFVPLKVVMAGLDLAIHVLAKGAGGTGDRVDTRVEPAHDDFRLVPIEM
jgi:hypothetical protein